MEYRERKHYLNELVFLEEKLNSLQREVYVTESKLSKGTILTQEMVYRELRYLDQPQECFITEEEMGHSLALDVEEGTCLTVSMLGQPTKNKREVFVSEVDFPAFIQNGDRVDVRIRFRTAEEYVVLTDKIIKSSKVDGGFVLELTEEELLFLSSAISDATSYEDTSLYVVKYPEFGVTEAGVANYIAKKEVLTLLGKEKSEGESRSALEERLMQCQ